MLSLGSITFNVVFSGLEASKHRNIAGDGVSEGSLSPSAHHSPSPDEGYQSSPGFSRTVSPESTWLAQVRACEEDAAEPHSVPSEWWDEETALAGT